MRMEITYDSVGVMVVSSPWIIECTVVFHFCNDSLNYINFVFESCLVICTVPDPHPVWHALFIINVIEKLPHLIRSVPDWIHILCAQALITSTVGISIYRPFIRPLDSFIENLRDPKFPSKMVDGKNKDSSL